jgi:hypothetical protein
MMRGLALSLAAMAVMSCRASVPVLQTKAWLDSKAGPSKIELTGKWDSGPLAGGGWGEGNFTQQGSHFSGTLGLYSVDGVVNGKEVFMVMSSGNTVYTAHLTRTGEGTFTGKYVNGALIEPEGAGDPISLKRMWPATGGNGDQESQSSRKG